MGDKPRYNYMETLKNERLDQLFILDSYGYNKAGSYYLGENGNWFVPDEICSLIQSIREKENYKKIVMLGSSKGGTCAIYYGILCHADAVLSGAPQYRVGDYLNIEKHRPILSALQGDTSQRSIEQLNDYLKDVIQSHAKDDNNPVIYLHYSPKEIMYEEHIIPLRKELIKNGYVLIEDNCYEYEDHQQVGKYFIPFIRNKMKEL